MTRLSGLSQQRAALSLSLSLSLSRRCFPSLSRAEAPRRTAEQHRLGSSSRRDDVEEHHDLEQQRLVADARQRPRRVHLRDRPGARAGPSSAVGPFLARVFSARVSPELAKNEDSCPFFVLSFFSLHGLSFSETLALVVRSDQSERFKLRGGQISFLTPGVGRELASSSEEEAAALLRPRALLS